MVITAAAIITLRAFVHVAFAALLIVIMPERFFNHFAHAIVHMYCSAIRGGEIQEG